MNYLNPSTSLVLVCVMLSCGDRANEAREQAQTQIDKNKHDSAMAVPVREVIFFAPSSTELDSMLSAPGGESLNEVFSDFDFYVSEFMSAPGRTDLKIRYISDKIITVPTNTGPYVIKRDEGPGFGIILTDHRQPPHIVRGVMVAEEYRQICKKYFATPSN